MISSIEEGLCIKASIYTQGKERKIMKEEQGGISLKKDIKNKEILSMQSNEF